MPQQLGETWRPRVRALRREHRLSRARDSEPKLPPRRYARSGPGELLHLDVKKLGRIEGVGHRITGVRTHRNRGIGWDHVHVGTDDHSRAA